MKEYLWPLTSPLSQTLFYPSYSRCAIPASHAFYLTKSTAADHSQLVVSLDVHRLGKWSCILRFVLTQFDYLTILSSHSFLSNLYRCVSEDMRQYQPSICEGTFATDWGIFSSLAAELSLVAEDLLFLLGFQISVKVFMFLEEAVLLDLAFGHLLVQERLCSFAKIGKFYAHLSS